MSNQETKSQSHYTEFSSEFKEKQTDAFSWFKPQEQKFVLPKRKAGYLKWLSLFSIMFGIIIVCGYFWYVVRLNRSLPIFPKHIVARKLPLDSELPAGVVSAGFIQASDVPVTRQATATPDAEEKQFKLVVQNTPTGYLNVRKEPSVLSPIITQIYPEEVYPYTVHQTGWYKIVLPGPSEGWVSEQYVKEM